MPSRIYEWQRWFKRTRFRLIRGKHYQVTSYIMAQQVRNRASRRGLLVSIKVKDDHIEVVNKGAA